MRQSAAAALALTVLLFGGAYLAAGKHPAQETEPDGGAVRQLPRGGSLLQRKRLGTEVRGLFVIQRRCRTLGAATRVPMKRRT